MIPDTIREISGNIGGTFLTWQTIKAKIAKIKPNIGTKLNGNDKSAIIQAKVDTFFVSVEYS